VPLLLSVLLSCTRWFKLLNLDETLVCDNSSTKLFSSTHVLQLISINFILTMAKESSLFSRTDC